MDPYDILGLRKDATLEEIKKAYRREAMKWHPDRSDNSAEAKHRFHQAADAYQFLTKNYSANENDDFGAGSDYRYQSSNYEQSEYASNSEGGTEDRFADSVFWEVILDYAIKLAQSGLQQHEISTRLSQNGCSNRLAGVIADKAFNIHAHYASNWKKKSNPESDKTTFKEERLEAELQRAFLGRGNLLLSPRDTIEYYLVAFSEFRQIGTSNPLFKIISNDRLMRILYFSMLFFAIVTVAINLYPGSSQYKLLPDKTLLQLPLGILSLMLVWMMYRKLWLLTCIFGLIFLATLVFFNFFISQALQNNLDFILPIAIISYAPFIFIAMFANYFYYRKAQKTIGSANHLFEDQQDKIIWLKNRAGTSSAAAIIFILILASSFMYLENDKYFESISTNLFGSVIKKDDVATRKARLRLKDANRFFDIAEAHFNSSPPDYLKASMSYTIAADNGSLLAAYKLGYMYYVGEGVKQNDLLALEYFELAVNSPLAFQPHSLELTTAYLAESYNNLGIMHHGGFGTKINTKLAFEMYSKAKQFGSKNAKLNLKTLKKYNNNIERKSLVKPSYH